VGEKSLKPRGFPESWLLEGPGATGPMFLKLILLWRFWALFFAADYADERGLF
jgi:hypothetical protein